MPKAVERCGVSQRAENVQRPTGRLRGAAVEALNRMDPDLVEPP